MPSLRDIRARIGSVKNTRQITNAMKMVSAAKLRRATAAATNARPYQQALTGTLQRVAAKAGEDFEHPLLTASAEVKRIAVIVYSSDRGLCGSFNSSINRKTEELLRKWKSEGKEILVWTNGKRSRDFLKSKGYSVVETRIELKPARFESETQHISEWLTTNFRSRFDEAWLCFNQYKNTFTQVPTFVRILPLSVTSEDSDSAKAGPVADYLYEPNAAEILGNLLPLYMRTLIYQAFLETEAGEHAARMAAMDSATRNASDLIDRLTLEYNRSRQATITKELIEIISGAEAL
jgi:F-type H+-transporting ATPase subunit gamma